MASVLHGSARTTPRVRAELQASKESSRSLAVRYGLNPKTVVKWRQRTTTSDAPMGPGNPRSTVLTPAEEAIVVEFRRRTLLPLDDVLGCLRDTIPNLSRSALHRCLERHGISRLPAGDQGEKRGRFKTYEIGYVHIDSCELRHADGKLVMFLAIDRVSKFTYVEFHDHAGKMEGAAFLRNVVQAFPHQIHTVLTDNGMAFADLPKNREGPTRRFLGPHIFDRVCIENGIEHRLTKPYHPWTNGQAERMNRTVKDATVKVFHYDDLESLKAHILAFVTAYNFAKHLKALRWRTPFKVISDAWTRDPSTFKINPHHLIPGSNILPGGGHRWMGRDGSPAAPGFFLPVRVLSRLFRRQFLEGLRAAFEAGRLRFFGALADLAESTAFATCIARMRRIDWVVYAKPPFGGPEQVLAYLGRYTHRVAIANSRLTSIENGQVAFCWKDYRHHDKGKVMTLSADEFIRRFLLHTLPDGFHRIRHYGFLANGRRAAKLARCRRLLEALPPPPPPIDADYRERYRRLTGHALDICPCCGGAMRSFGALTPGQPGEAMRIGAMV